jgi:copper chaperone NosL
MTRLPHRLAVLLGALLLGACSAPDQAPLQPTELTRESYCALDGMLLADYPGPKAQIHYAGQPAPEFFCDTVEMFALLLKPEQARRVSAAFVQDLDKTSWDAPQGAWMDAKQAFYVVGTRKRAAMGPTLPSFGTRAGAEKFAKAEGGKVLGYAEITPDMVRLDGGALHDQHM